MGIHFEEMKRFLETAKPLSTEESESLGELKSIVETIDGKIRPLDFPPAYTPTIFGWNEETYWGEVNKYINSSKEKGKSLEINGDWLAIEDGAGIYFLHKINKETFDVMLFSYVQEENWSNVAMATVKLMGEFDSNTNLDAELYVNYAARLDGYEYSGDVKDDEEIQEKLFFTLANSTSHLIQKCFYLQNPLPEEELWDKVSGIETEITNLFKEQEIIEEVCKNTKIFNGTDKFSQN